MELGDGENQPDRGKAIKTYYANTLQHIQHKRSTTADIPYDQIAF